MPNSSQKINFPMTVLIILDGWGVAPPGDNNIIDIAQTPFFDYLNESYPVTSLTVSSVKPLTPENIYKKIGSLEKKSIGFFLANKDFRQYRLGESENIALLTDFFDQGDLAPGNNYKVKIISTPLSNDLNSRSTCINELGREIVKKIKKNQTDFIAVNFASVEKLIVENDHSLAIKARSRRLIKI
jgi:bisphosphoglycerate-independent phosphoglycerate mutase (AlkP superfamily)